jgi:small-conductance mechanosensitive channel
VPLAFLVNDAGSEYFQGLLLILARRPYDIGDCISISEPTEDAKINGSQPWFVQGITLFTTTVRNGLSNEVATISNGALAKTRIINAARSPKAQVFVYLKFSIDIPYEKVKIFHTVIKEFVRDHPREWIQLCAFRALTVEADEG